MPCLILSLHLLLAFWTQAQTLAVVFAVPDTAQSDDSLTGIIWFGGFVWVYSLPTVLSLFMATSERFTATGFPLHFIWSTPVNIRQSPLPRLVPELTPFPHYCVPAQYSPRSVLIAPCPDIADINFLMCQVLKAVKRHYRITNLADIRRNTYRNVLRFTTTNMIFSHEVPLLRRQNNTLWKWIHGER